MSRIHEALKKAEQERATAQLTATETAAPPRECGGSVTCEQ